MRELPNVGAHSIRITRYFSGAGDTRLSPFSLGGHLHPKFVPVCMALPPGQDAASFARRKYLLASASSHRWGFFLPV